MIRSTCFLILTLIALGTCTLPRSQTDEKALKQFLIRNNRLPYPNETVSETDQPPVKSWTTCEGCKLLVVEIRNIVRNPQEVANLKQLLERFCDLGILHRYKNECLNMADNLIVVLHEIEPLLSDPTAVCEELHYCPDGTRVTPTQRLALLWGYKFLQMVQPNRANDIPCDECIFAVTELKSLIQSASIQAELKQELHKLCRMAGKYEVECSAMVDQYFDLLIQEAVQLLSDARKVCVDIGFCNGRRSGTSVIKIRPAHVHSRLHLREQGQGTCVGVGTSKLETFSFVFKRIQTRQGINAGCLVCQAAFTTMIDLLSQEQVAAQVTTDMTKIVCDVIPDTMKRGCLDFMSIYSRAFLQLTLTQFTPSELCSAIGICKPEDETKINQLAPAEKSAAVCEACQVVSQYLSFELQQPDFQKEIICTLERICYILPGDYERQVRCQTIIQTYYPYVLENIIIPELSKLCSTFGMCSLGQGPPPAGRV